MYEILLLAIVAIIAVLELAAGNFASIMGFHPAINISTYHRVCSGNEYVDKSDFMSALLIAPSSKGWTKIFIYYNATEGSNCESMLGSKYNDTEYALLSNATSSHDEY